MDIQFIFVDNLLTNYNLLIISLLWLGDVIENEYQMSLLKKRIDQYR